MSSSGDVLWKQTSAGSAVWQGYPSLKKVPASPRVSTYLACRHAARRSTARQVSDCAHLRRRIARESRDIYLGAPFHSLLGRRLHLIKHYLVSSSDEVDEFVGRKWHQQHARTWPSTTTPS